jgi:C1A family cysteine protease
MVIILFLLFVAVPSLAADRQKTPLPFSPDDSLEAVREKIKHNGYTFTVDHNWVVDMSPEMRREFFSRHPSRSARLGQAGLAEDIGPLAEHLGKALPSSFDWRSYNGHSYIGPIRDQGQCGSCYAFAACAAAEGTYNWANGLVDGNCADFSESFVIWCLGSLEEYNQHFYGCDGADYDYMELEALVVEGVCNESAYPYTTVQPSSCTHWNDPRTTFFGWRRINCGDIDAMKTAIMTYGVVDAAVYASQPAFMGYSGGIYEDSLTACDNTPCYYAQTDHAISLVGWDDNGDPENNGYWILRNSWGTTWGENGYMRIKYRSARASCESAYLFLNSSQPTPTPSGPTPTPLPGRLSVTLNKSTYQPGDILTIDVSFLGADLDWDGYVVLSGPGGVYSVLGSNLKKGVYPIVSNAMETHAPFSGRVFSMEVPYGVQGSYECICAILPTGTAATMNNARGPFSQMAETPFQVSQYRDRRPAASP